MRLSKRLAIIATSAVATVAVASGAFAYWTTSGGGSGSASVGNASAVTITPVTITGTLVPGGAAASVAFTINNPSATDVKVGGPAVDNSGPDGIVGNSDDLTNGISGLPAGCSASDFTFSSSDTGYSVAHGGTASGSGTLSMSNSTSDQNTCKGASLALHLKV